MEIKNTGDVITITLKKSDHKELFGRVPVMRNLEAYFKYLLSLDTYINGTEDVMYGHDSYESFSMNLEKMTIDKILETRDQLIDDIIEYIEMLNKFIPEEYKFAYEYECVEFIPEDDWIAYMHLCASKLKNLLGFMKEKGID